MAMWVKCGAFEVAFDNDVIPRESMERLTEMAQLSEQVSHDLEQQRVAAREQAQQALACAEEQAEMIAAKARRDAAAATRLGYAQGRRDGLRHWHAQAVAERAANAALYASQRDRLADLVVQAMASLMQGPALAAYLENALQVLDQLAEDEQSLSVTVHPEDRTVAEKAIERLRHQWRDGTVVKIIVSQALAPGSCICESPRSYVDASLAQQLAALRLAARGALDDLQLPDDVLAATPEQGHADKPSGTPLPAETAASMPNFYDLPSPAYHDRGDSALLGTDDEDRFDDLYDDEDDDEDRAGDAASGHAGRSW